MSKLPRYAWIIIVLTTLVLWFYSNFHGLGLTHDSHNYVKSAEDLDGLSLAPQTFLINLLSLTSSNQEILAASINGICFLFTLVVWGRLFVQSQLSQQAKLLGFGMLAFGIPLLSVASFLWTEMLFIFLMSLSFFGYSKWKSTNQVHWLLFTLFFAVLSIWARKIGLVFFVSVAFVLPADFMKSDRKRHLVFFLVIQLLFIFWLFFFSVEKPQLSYVGRNLDFNVNALINWIVPVTFPGFVRYFCFGLLFILLFATKPASNPIHRLFGYFFVLYFLIRLPVDREFPEEADRYFSILFPPFIFLFAHYIDAYLLKFPVRQKIIVVSMMLLMLFSLSRSIKNSLHWRGNRSKNPKLEITSSYIFVDAKTSNSKN